MRRVKEVLMNFTMEILNGLSFILIILAFYGVLILVVIAVKMNADMNEFSYRKFVVLALFLILITLLSIAGMMITY